MRVCVCVCVSFHMIMRDSMATIEKEGLETKVEAAEDQCMFPVSVGKTTETLSSERYLMAASKRDGFVLTRAQLTHSTVTVFHYSQVSLQVFGGGFFFPTQNHIYSGCSVKKWLILVSSYFGGEQQKWETKKRFSSQILLTFFWDWLQSQK